MGRAEERVTIQSFLAVWTAALPAFQLQLFQSLSTITSYITTTNTTIITTTNIMTNTKVRGIPGWPSWSTAQRKKKCGLRSSLTFFSPWFHDVSKGNRNFKKKKKRKKEKEKGKGITTPRNQQQKKWKKMPSRQERHQNCQSSSSLQTGKNKIINHFSWFHPRNHNLPLLVLLIIHGKNQQNWI